MKPKWGLKLILSLLIVQSLVSWMPIRAQGASLPTSTEKVAEAVTDAKYVLALAAKNNAQYAPFFERALKAIGGLQFSTLPMGTDYAYCRQFNVYARYFPSKNTVILCELALKQTHNRLVQTIIHEATHAAGYANECDATRLSIYAMMSATRPVQEVGYDCAL